MKASEDFSPEARFVFIDYFTKSLKALPALNAGTLQAAILIFSPVCGFLPSRAVLAIFSMTIIYSYIHLCTI